MKSPTSDSTSPIASPCIRVCELDADQVCTGCLRTLQEIGSWSSATEAEKFNILQRVEQRRSAH